VIGVLVSGSGTNLQALIDDGLPITAVAANVPGVWALERAEGARIPTAAFALSRLSHGPYGPTPIGIFRDARQPTVEELAWELVEIFELEEASLAAIRQLCS